MSHPYDDFLDGQDPSLVDRNAIRALGIENVIFSLEDEDLSEETVVTVEGNEDISNRFLMS